MRGGKRTGAGRPKKIEGLKRHFLYCTNEEFQKVKNRLEWNRKKMNPQYFMEAEDYVFDYLAEAVPGKPIFIENLVHGSNGRIETLETCREIIRKIAEENPGLKIRKYSPDIYYRTIRKRCGELRIDYRELFAIRFMKDDGWYTAGYDLLNKMGLSTLVPAYSEIVSNSVQEEIVDGILRVKIYPAKAKITKENRMYFTALEAISRLGAPCIDADNPIRIIKDFIIRKKLDSNCLEEIARKYFNQTTSDNLFLCEGGEKNVSA